MLIIFLYHTEKIASTVHLKAANQIWLTPVVGPTVHTMNFSMGECAMLQTVKVLMWKVHLLVKSTKESGGGIS